jgi:hypothetical protein
MAMALKTKKLTVSEKMKIIQELEKNPTVTKWNFKVFCAAAVVIK